MIDRVGRDNLIDAVNAFLDGELLSDAFDEKISELCVAAQDATVADYCEQFLNNYVDMWDDPTDLDREQWNHLQRVLLILKSNATLSNGETSSSWGCFLALFAAIAWGLSLYQFGWATYQITIPMCLIAFGPAYLLKRKVKRQYEMSGASNFEPFASRADLETVRRDTPAFKKRPFPGHRDLKKNSCLEWITEAMGFIMIIGFMLLLPPILILTVIAEIFPSRAAVVQLPDCENALDRAT